MVSAIACGAGSLGLPHVAQAQAAKPASGKEADRNLQVTAAPAAAFPGQSAGKRVALVIGNSAATWRGMKNRVIPMAHLSAASGMNSPASAWLGLIILLCAKPCIANP